MTAARALRCKAGDLAFITRNRLSLGKIVHVVEREADFNGRPTWRVVAQGAPMLARMYDGSVESVMDWWAEDGALTPIRPGPDKPAEKTVKRKPKAVKPTKVASP